MENIIVEYGIELVCGIHHTLMETSYLLWCFYDNKLVSTEKNEEVVAIHSQSLPFSRLLDTLRSSYLCNSGYCFGSTPAS